MNVSESILKFTRFSLYKITIMKLKNIVLCAFCSILFISCFEDLDDNLQIGSTAEINDFIYRGLNYFYLYKADTPELANDYFADAQDKKDFLNSYATPEALFDYLLSPQDRFSRLFSDYVVIENSLAGVNMSNGMEFGLVYYPDNSRNVFGYVRYILPNSAASQTDLKRGDIFTQINGTQINESNYQQLLASDAYTISLADYDGTHFNLTGETIELVKEEYDENPVYLSRIFELEGKKIGYLMYTAFTRRYDTELNTVFGQFQSEGITDLILDLRYNGGGSVETATDLASMITGQFNGEVFYKEFWNEDRQAEYGGEGYFDNKISTGATINSLNLNRVYVLTTSSTASASELVINGLEPYIDVVQIGDNTTGKFQASFLMYDAPEPYFSRQQASPLHTYVMLPLVFKTANKNGVTDFTEGLLPDIYQRENYFDLGALGSPDEPLTATALAMIGVSTKPQQKTFQEFEQLSGSNEIQPLFGTMIINAE